MVSISFRDSRRTLVELASNLTAVSSANDEIFLKNSTWASPLSVVPVCALAKARGLRIKYEDESNDTEVRGYLRAVDFPAGVSSVKFSARRSYLPLTCLNLQVAGSTLNEVVSEYVSLILSKSNADERPDLRSALSHALGEMSTNVAEHARAENYWLFAQYWPQKRGLEFCIVDDGVGIRDRFLEAGVAFESDTGAIEAAIQGRSVKQPSSALPGDRGHGLGSTVRLITGQEFSGSFLLISGGGGYVRHRNRQAKMFKFSTGWQGVLVCARLFVPEERMELFKYLG